MEAFKLNVRFILPRIFGLRMCPRCPRCNESEHPCANKFGNNFEPWGGIGGMTAALGCVIEYQHNNNPHAHGNAHQVTAYQHKTLEQIKTLIEKIFSSHKPASTIKQHYTEKIISTTNNTCEKSLILKQLG